MARRATSLGPKPSLFSVLLCFLFLFCFFVFVFGLGFKGQVRWPKGPPHLALNPPYLFFFVFLCFAFPFLCLLPIDKNPVFPLDKDIFCLFLSVSLCFPLAFSGLPLFSFSFSVSLLFFSFFLPSCLSWLLSFASWFLSLSFLFFLLCFCFMKRTTSKYSSFPSSIVSLVLVSCLVFSLKSLFSYLCFFSDLKNQSWKKKKKTQMFGKKGGCNKTFFVWTCVLQNVKSYRFFCPFFWPILVDVQKTQWK